MSNYQNISNKPLTLFIFTNGPGEISTWVRPILASVYKQNPAFQVVVFLTPCQYSTGREIDILSTFPNVSKVFSPKQSMQLVFSPFSKNAIHKLVNFSSDKASVLFLGGDPMYANFFGFRLGIPKYAYTENDAFSNVGYTKVFKRSIHGDLMKDNVYNYLSSIKASVDLKSSDSKEFDILFFCGSRPRHFKLLAPLICEAVDIIHKSNSSLNLCIGVSPFIKEKEINALKNQFSSLFETNILSIRHEHSLGLLSKSQILITIPGSNTAEAMYMKVPMLVLIPLNNPEELIFDGVIGLFFKLPGIGKVLTSLFISFLKKQNKCYSIPNLLSKTNVVTEIAQLFDKTSIADVVLNFFNDKNRQKNQLEQLTPLHSETAVSTLILSEIFK